MRSELRELLQRRPDGTVRWSLPMRRGWNRILQRLRPLGGTSSGNEVVLFFDGDAVYDAMLAAIRAATRRVWLEVYIFEPDRPGTAFLDALREAAARGVEVRLLVDGLGSSHLGEAHLAPLRDAGAHVAVFNPPWRFRARQPWLERDHRKILVVDDVAFAGGMNISEDYAGAKWGNQKFRDTHALVQGPAVADLAAVFAASWFGAKRVRIHPGPPPPPLSEGMFIQVLGSGLAGSKRHIQRALYTTVGRCMRTCFLTTPYFIPPPRLLRALAAAARRGVDVRILTAGLSDVPIAAVAARHLYGTLLRAGVRVFELQGHVLHAKTAVVDGVYASVGSFNLDRWSFTRNLEVSFAAVDDDLAVGLADRFARDLASSREVNLEEWQERSVWQRIIGWFAYQVARL